MKTATIFYHSKTGTTKKYAEEIGKYLKFKGLDTQVTSTQDFRADLLNNVDYVLFGCWTNGLMVILQHPDQEWKDFAAKLPSKPGVKVALFTTYKILTGSMFRNMYKHLKGKFAASALELKSRNGLLSEIDKQALENLIS
jgi:flavodoxin